MSIVISYFVSAMWVVCGWVLYTVASHAQLRVELIEFCASVVLFVSNLLRHHKGRPWVPISRGPKILQIACAPILSDMSYRQVKISLNPQRNCYSLMAAEEATLPLTVPTIISFSIFYYSFSIFHIGLFCYLSC